MLVSLLIIIEVLVCLMLSLIILVQKTKSEGLGMAFGAGAGEAMFGARAGNVLTKATIYLGIVFLANTLILGVLFSRNTNSSIAEQLTSEQAPPAATEMSAALPTEMPAVDTAAPSEDTATE